MLLDPRNLQRMQYVIGPNPAETPRVKKHPDPRLYGTAHFVVVSPEDAQGLALHVAHGAQSPGFGLEFHGRHDHVAKAVA